MFQNLVVYYSSKYIGYTSCGYFIGFVSDKPWSLFKSNAILSTYMLLSVIFSPNKFEGNHFIHVNVAVGHLVHNVAGGYLVHVHAAGSHNNLTFRTSASISLELSRPDFLWDVRLPIVLHCIIWFLHIKNPQYVSNN